MKKIKDFFKKLISCCPLGARIALLVFALSIGLYCAFVISPEFSDFYNRYPAAFFRAAGAFITGFFPFSLAETVLIIMPVIVVVMVWAVIRTSKKSLREMVSFTFCMLAVLSFFFSSFTLSFASGYRGSTLDRKLGIKREKVSAAELDETARILLFELESIIGEIDFLYNSSSNMPYGIAEMGDKLNDAYKSLSEKYSFIPNFRSRVKQVVFSEAMTYTHISGVYTYFTGEANININFPEYTLPFTAAHELAHQRGIAREDEANFVAFLVCIESDDPYIRYSGYMNLFEYVISALYKADKELYRSLMTDTDTSLRYEISAYNKFFEKYSNNIAADISGAVNDSYLSSQGQSQGSKSYGMVVDLAVAYYKTNK